MVLKLGSSRKSVPTETRRFTQKRWRYCKNCALQSLASSQKKYKR